MQSKNIKIQLQIFCFISVEIGNNSIIFFKNEAWFRIVFLNELFIIPFKPILTINRKVTTGYQTPFSAVLLEIYYCI